MNTESLLSCGVVFRSTADPEAAWKLVEALESSDPALRMLAQTFLVEGGAASISILETALSAGVVSTVIVAPCIEEILRTQPQMKGTFLIKPSTDSFQHAGGLPALKED